MEGVWRNCVEYMILIWGKAMSLMGHKYMRRLSEVFQNDLKSASYTYT